MITHTWWFTAILGALIVVPVMVSWFRSVDKGEFFVTEEDKSNVDSSGESGSVDNEDTRHDTRGSTEDS